MSRRLKLRHLQDNVNATSEMPASFVHSVGLGAESSLMGLRVKIMLAPSPSFPTGRSFYLLSDYADADAAEADALSFIAIRKYDPEKVNWRIVDTLDCRHRPPRIAIDS